jgi:hypothetical protein
VAIVDALPRNAIGKVLKRELRERWRSCRGGSRRGTGIEGVESTRAVVRAIRAFQLDRLGARLVALRPYRRQGSAAVDFALHDVAPNGGYSLSATRRARGEMRDREIVSSAEVAARQVSSSQRTTDSVRPAARCSRGRCRRRRALRRSRR